jgi:hypothetical protein
MLPRLVRQLGLIAAVAATGATCKGDPTAEGIGTPSALQAALASMNIDIGKSGTIEVAVVDIHQTPPATITFTTCNAAIATVATDMSPPCARNVVACAGDERACGTTCVVITSAGVAPDTVGVNVLKAGPTISRPGTCRPVLWAPR